jgi:hypothetical protein
LPVLLELPGGIGLIAPAKFVSLDCLPSSHLYQEIPWIRLGQESAIENIIGTFRPQFLKNTDNDITKLVEWENGPLLISAELWIPVILDRIDQAKAQVT